MRTSRAMTVSAAETMRWRVTKTRAKAVAAEGRTTVVRSSSAFPRRDSEYASEHVAKMWTGKVEQMRTDDR